MRPAVSNDRSMLIYFTDKDDIHMKKLVNGVKKALKRETHI